jgi:PAS domain S-box-containing protein
MPAEGYSSTTIKTPVYDILKKIAKERGVSISDVIEEATIEMGDRAPELESIDSISAEMQHLISTTQKMQEKAIRKVERIINDYKRSQEKYQTLVETNPDLVFSIDPAGNFTYANPVIYDYLKMRSSEAIGENILDFVHKDDVGKLEVIIESLREGKKSTVMLKFLDEEGNEKYLNLSISPIMKNGKVMEAVGVADDLSEHQRMINKIAYLKQFNESIVQNAPLGIITFDRDGNITSFNDVFPKLLLCTKDKLKGGNVFEDAVDGRLEKWYRRCLTGESCEYHGACSISEKGIERTYHKWFSPIKIGGEVIGGVCIVDDITEKGEVNRNKENDT